jgi:hypothetical protein
VRRDVRFSQTKEDFTQPSVQPILRERVAYLSISYIGSKKGVSPVKGQISLYPSPKKGRLVHPPEYIRGAFLTEAL